MTFNDLFEPEMTIGSLRKNIAQKTRAIHRMSRMARVFYDHTAAQEQIVIL